MSDIEEHIRRAIEEGKFDDLPGKGKPLRIDGDPLTESEWGLAYHMLKSAGYTLPWIEMSREIDLEIADARRVLQRAWEWRREALAEGQSNSAVESEWQRALQVFREQVEQINKRILDFNLQAPSERFQRLMLKVDQEIEKILNGV